MPDRVKGAAGHPTRFGPHGGPTDVEWPTTLGTSVLATSVLATSVLATSVLATSVLAGCAGCPAARSGGTLICR